MLRYLICSTAETMASLLGLILELVHRQAHYFPIQMQNAEVEEVLRIHARCLLEMIGRLV